MVEIASRGMGEVAAPKAPKLAMTFTNESSAGNPLDDTEYGYVEFNRVASTVVIQNASAFDLYVIFMNSDGTGFGADSYHLADLKVAGGDPIVVVTVLCKKIAVLADGGTLNIDVAASRDVFITGYAGE